MMYSCFGDTSLKKVTMWRIATKMVFEPFASVTLAKMLMRIIRSFSALKTIADSLSFFVYPRILSRSACVNCCFCSCSVMMTLRGLSCEKF